VMNNDSFRGGQRLRDARGKEGGIRAGSDCHRGWGGEKESEFGTKSLLDGRARRKQVSCTFLPVPGRVERVGQKKETGALVHC